ncbi:MAG: sodium-dependent transporter [Paludibacteraceae bacterium]|nr:sodium-dependent transporter [Paludibacteraceae bacterium]
MKNQTEFKSKFGMLAAAVGSAVGLGNIWKFPYVVGTNGGGAFLIIYILCVLILGFPALITELSIGRMAKTNTLDACGVVSGKKCWNFIGAFGIISAFLIMSFYFVVAGWSLEYIYQTFATNSFDGIDTPALQELFNTFAYSSYRPYLWLFIFILTTSIIVSMGVQKGIEKASKVMMPMLFAIIAILAIYVAFLPRNVGGYRFYLDFDLSKITFPVILSALGQSFFSLSLGLGAIMVYGSYMKEGNVVGISFQIALLDTLIAVLAGFVIFPAVFAYGIAPGEGPSLAYIALPAVFSQMPGGLIVSLLFFALLAIGALTSTISLMEVLTSNICEKWHFSRQLANLIVTMLALISTVLCCYSMADGSKLIIFGRTLFTLFDDITSKFFLPLGGMAMAIFLGWGINKDKLRTSLAEFGMKPIFFNIYLIFVRFVIPITILMVMIQQK